MVHQCKVTVLETKCLDELIDENERALAFCRQRGLRCCLVNDSYDVGSPKVGPLSGNDFDVAAKLFYDTVHSVCARDYTPGQLDAWAPRDDRHLAQIAGKLAEQQAIGVKECGILVGFGSLDDEGDIDMLFVHKDRQGQGIAKTILHELEHLAMKRDKQVVSTFASVTARPFFERMSYVVVRKNIVDRDGVSLVNYLMSRQFS